MKFNIKTIDGIEWIPIDDAYDYVMETDIDSVRDTILEQEGQAYEDTRNDMD